MSALVTSAQFSGGSTTTFVTRKEVQKETPLILSNNKFLTLSNFSNALKSSQIDPVNSNVYKDGDDLLFDLNFFSGQDERITLNGSYSSKKLTSEFNISYQFERDELLDGESRSSKYELNMSIKAENFNLSKETKHYEKEDMLKFIRRITNEIMDVVRDKKKTFKGIIFNSEDLSEIAGGDEKGIGSLLQKLIYTLLMMEQLKTYQKKGKDVEEVTLIPERKTYEVTEKELSTNTNFSYSASVKKLE